LHLIYYFIASILTLVFKNNSSDIYNLANFKNSYNKKSIDIASQINQSIIKSHYFFMEKYEIINKPPEHKSLTSLVMLANDEITGQIVAIKLLKHYNNYENEIKCRINMNKPSGRYIINILQENMIVSPI
jgi:hypothetical protein